MTDVIRELIGELFLQGDQSLPIPHDADLLQAGILDSLGMVELTAALERRFSGLRIPDQDVCAEHFSSIGKIADYIRARTG